MTIPVTIRGMHFETMLRRMVIPPSTILVIIEIALGRGEMRGVASHIWIVMISTSLQGEEFGKEEL
jgi:hypothetical protein